MKRRIFLGHSALFLAAGALAAPLATGAALPDTVARVKRSIVGVGTHLQTRSPAVAFAGTGFVVGDGLSVITNAHVVPDQLDAARKETLGVVVGDGAAAAFRPATLVALDREHDLAHLRLEGAPLPALNLAEREDAREGQELAFTGFPLGMVLGLYPATHRALLAAITPVVRPSLSARGLDARAIAQLQRAPFMVYQLDGTAYPGNSGSPVYDPDTGTVLAVVNMVFVKGLKETAITNPSGITYAVPVRHVRALLQRP
ncbi:serine protease [Massilia sp. YIM B02443]|uniref:S1 family peptidase n=1 Tax=Massilia sp. YIM B02443 TaxID=3050127 RepID=UPI0025B67744|nr:serine protease [Massilia sp. YIM B02443]MDN4038023.1 serine protease [Massilia sp. YIM B02443]